jgi:hypothetical protein
LPARRAAITTGKQSNRNPRGQYRTERFSGIVGDSEVVLLTAEEQAVRSGRLKRKRDTFLPLPEHAIAHLHEFRVRFNVGLQFFAGVRNCSFYAIRVSAGRVKASLPSASRPVGS